MIRHATFALVLVVAAFAGGAAVSGPGLAWLRKAIGSGPSIIVDADSAPNPPPASGKPKQFPTAKADPLRVDLDLDRARPGPRRAAEPRDLALSEPSLPPESPSTPAAALIRLPGAPAPEAPAMPPASAPALAPPRFADRGPATPASPLPPLELPPETIPAKADPVARLASNAPAPALAPPEGMPPDPTPPPVVAPSPEPPPPSSPSPARDWGEIRRRLRDLGVTRYRIEAETAGRVRFSCVIPVEGLRAVAHHFEAEGDDEPQAAEAALKRVALWRATERK